MAAHLSWKRYRSGTWRMPLTWDPCSLDAQKFNADISLWKTPRNEQMFNMFSECEEFNSNLALWDVSHVVDMRDLLAGASKFNKPIGHWNTSSVTNMQDMFRRAVSFSQDISKWDVRNVVDFSGMFKDAIKFAGDVSKWDVDWPHSSITFANMFSGALAFNNKWGVRNIDERPAGHVRIEGTILFQCSR